LKNLQPPFRILQSEHPEILLAYKIKGKLKDKDMKEILWFSSRI